MILLIICINYLINYVKRWVRVFICGNMFFYILEVVGKYCNSINDIFNNMLYKYVGS